MPDYLQDKKTFSVGGEQKELFMSYSAINHLAGAVGGPENLMQPGNRTMALLIMLGRDNAGAIPEDVNLEGFGLTVSEGDEIVDWIGEHLQDFMIGQVNRVVDLAAKSSDDLDELLKRLEGVNPNLAASLTGMAASASETPSAGA